MTFENEIAKGDNFIVTYDFPARNKILNVSLSSRESVDKAEKSFAVGVWRRKLITYIFPGTTIEFNISEWQAAKQEPGLPEPVHHTDIRKYTNEAKN